MTQPVSLRAIYEANPLLGQPLPQPQPMSSLIIDTVRAHKPGGELLGYVQSEGLLYFEQLYRVLAPKGFSKATPQKPVTFLMGSFRVPRSQVLVIEDYSFDIYRFSGITAGDYLSLEQNRLSTQVGWDIRVDDKRPASLSYQIIPQPQTQTQAAFASTNPLAPAEHWQFEQVRAQELQGPAGPALSLMPQRHHRRGLVKVSNQYHVRSGSTLVVTCSIINPISIPIAFFEANVMGILMPQNMYDAYQSANVPIGDPTVPPIPGTRGT